MDQLGVMLSWVSYPNVFSSFGEEKIHFISFYRAGIAETRPQNEASNKRQRAINTDPLSSGVTGSKENCVDG